MCIALVVPENAVQRDQLGRFQYNKKNGNMAMSYPMRSKACHLPLKLKMEWTVVIIWKRASSVVFHPEDLLRSLCLLKHK